MRKSIKRVIAGVLSAVLTLGLVNLSALSMSLARELSGYEIGVEYTQDNTSATLTGNTSGVREGVQLDKLVDSDGQELDPVTFSQTVEKNGTYHFTLHYLETVAAQDGTEETTEEKTQELEVVVDGIVKPESQENPDAGTDAVQESVSNLASSAVEAAKTAVPVDVLKRSMATALAEGRATSTINVDIYASEVEYKLRTIAFGGGDLEPGAENLPQVTSRSFLNAAYIPQGSTAQTFITGLYYYQVSGQATGKWYYTLKGNTSTAGGIDVSVGFELPEGASIRLYYQPSSQTKNVIKFSENNYNLSTDYKMTVNGNAYNSGQTYIEGSKIILEFNVPAPLRNVYVTVEEHHWAGYTDAASAIGTPLEDLKLIKVSDVRVTLMFTMPNSAANLRLVETRWDSSEIYEFALGTEGDRTQADEKVSNSYFRSTSGANTKAELTHVQGVDLQRGEIVYTNSRPITVNNQARTVSVGTYQKGQTVGLALRLEQHYKSSSDKDFYYTWKPTFLRMQVYVGNEVKGNSYRSYIIALPQNSGSLDTELKDIGATVTAQVTEWGEKKYGYNITVKGMIYSFVLMDCPVSTQQQNFLVTTLDGIDIAGSVLETNSSTGYTDLYEWTVYQGQIRKPAPSLSINFLLSPQYGYTKPVFDDANANFGNKVAMKDHGWWITKGNRYWFELQTQTDKDPDAPIRDRYKAPALLKFTSQPVTIQVKYYYNGTQFYDPKMVMSVSENTNYAIEYKVPKDGMAIKGYYVRVIVDGKTYDISKTNGENIWYPNNKDDIITFSRVYDTVRNAGNLSTNSSWELQIVPVPGTSTSGLINASYEIMFQHSFADLDNTQSDLRKKQLPADKATLVPGTVAALEGAEVKLFGAPEEVPREGKKYRLNTEASDFDGPANANTPFARLDYVLATTVGLQTGTLGSNSNGSDWLQGVQDKWYTSIGNFDHIIDITDLDPGTKDKMIFDGWEIQAGDFSIKINEDTMVWNDASTGKKYLSLAKIGRNESILWTKIFENGTFTLAATWRSTVQPVYSSGGSLVNSNNPRIEIQSGMTEMQITAEFQYGNGNETVDLGNLRALYGSGELKVKLFKKDPEKSWQVRTPNASIVGPEFSAESTTSKFTVTFTIKSGVTNASYNDGANFRILAWTSANSTAGLNMTDGGIADALNAADSTIAGDNRYTNSYETNSSYVNPFADKIPSVNTNTIIPSKVTLTNDLIDLDSSGYVGIIQNQTQSLTISGKFKYGGGNKTEGDIQALFDSGSLRIALFKKDPGATTQWTVRYPSGSSGIAKPTIIQGSGNTFEVTFTITSNVSGRWNNGANFRIYAWTSANVDGATVTADNVLTALNGTTMTYEDQIPGVNTYTEFIYPVKSEGGTSIGNIVTAKPVYIVKGQTNDLTVTATFYYEATSLSQQFIEHGLRIALLVKEPQIGTDTQKGWEVRENSSYIDFSKPTVTDNRNRTFTVTFTVDDASLANTWADGAQFLIYAWTDANPEGKGLTAQSIANTLNSGGTNAYLTKYQGKIPSVYNITRKVYDVINMENDTEGNVTVMSKGTSIDLTASFKYNYDAIRYPDGYKNGEKIQDLIDNGEISFKLELMKKNGSWTPVDVAADALKPWDATNGTLKFSCMYTPGGDLSTFNGAKFRISVESTANTTPAEYIITVNVVFPVQSSDGTIADKSVGSQRLLVGDTKSFEVTATFKYGTQTLTEKEVEDLIAANTIKLVLAKNRPPKGTKANGWVLWYSDNQSQGFNVKRSVTVGKDGLFTVTFTISNNNGNVGRLEDGAIYRIFAWSNANGASVSSLTGTTLVEALNTQKEDSEYNPYPAELPSAAKKFTMLYEMTIENKLPISITVLNIDKEISLSVDFKYDYDTDRYPQPTGYDGGRLQDLITAGDITATLEYKKQGDATWTLVDIPKDALKTWNASKGTIRFIYSYTPTGSMSAFDGAEFRIKVQSAANTTPVEQIVTVTYVSDASLYVSIPQYVILDDNSSNVTGSPNGEKLDGYAGKEVTVTYTTLGTQKTPEVDVWVEDGVLLKENSINGTEVPEMSIGIYGTDGQWIRTQKQVDNRIYSEAGTLSSTNDSVSFWMNVKRGPVKNQQYYASVMFLMEMSGTIT